MAGSALVAGVSGIVGNTLARHLLACGWDVSGLARRPPTDLTGLNPVAADLLDPAGLKIAVQALRPTNVFITTWLRQDSEAENIRVNSAMVRNLLDAAAAFGGSDPARGAGHRASSTTLAPSRPTGRACCLQTPFREEQGRLEVENFYYAQEDEVFAAAARDGFSWSVHRPHTVIGKAVGNAMNMGVDAGRSTPRFAVTTGRPFTVPRLGVCSGRG